MSIELDKEIARLLDIQVAKKRIGYEGAYPMVTDNGGCGILSIYYHDRDTGNEWSPSTNLILAWSLVERVHAQKDCLTLEYIAGREGFHYVAVFRIADAIGVDKRATTAIARAFVDWKSKHKEAKEP